MCLGKIERLVEVWDSGASRQGRAECGAILSLAFTPDAAPGAYVLAHSGVAVELLDASDAETALGIREAMDA
jgi:hydrogenase maturation factor